MSNKEEDDLEDFIDLENIKLLQIQQNLLYVRVPNFLLNFPTILQQNFLGFLLLFVL